MQFFGNTYPSFLLLLWAAGGLARNDTQDMFFNPGPAGLADDFSANPAPWVVGSTQVIDYATTASNYTVWLVHKQAKVVNIIAPISKTNLPGRSRDTWQVSTYGANLAASPVFYLWLNGTKDGAQFSIGSHYFNITAGTANCTTTTSATDASTLVTSSTIIDSTVTGSTVTDSTVAGSSPTGGASTDGSATSSPITSSPTNGAPAATSSVASSISSGDAGRTAGLGAGIGLGIQVAAVMAGFLA